MRKGGPKIIKNQDEHHTEDQESGSTALYILGIRSLTRPNTPPSQSMLSCVFNNITYNTFDGYTMTIDDYNDSSATRRFLSFDKV